MTKRGRNQSGEVYACELSLDRWELVRVALSRTQTLPGEGVTQFVRWMAAATLAEIAAQVPERGQE